MYEVVGKRKIIGEWSPLKNNSYILYLENEEPSNKFLDYDFFRIDGKIYTPIPISHTNGKGIALKGEGGFIGKEVEFLQKSIQSEIPFTNLSKVAIA